MAGAALAQPSGSGGKKGQRSGGYADPSLIIAAELAFDRLAVEKGQWTALGAIVAKDGVLFRPAPVFADAWLRSQRNPAVPVRWRTRQVFMACDGSSAISTGLSIRSGAGAEGRFINIWRREKKGYRLILSDDGPLTTPEAVRPADDLEAITARVATCPKRARPGGGGAPASSELPAIAPLDPRQPLPMIRDDRGDDGSLRWRWSVTVDGARTLEAWMATDEGEVRVLTDSNRLAAR